MIPTTLNSIIKNKLPCYFMSPHFDDAVFSAGSLLSFLSGKTKITLVNVFTKAGKQHTLSAKAYLRQCHYLDAQKLYQARKQEDEKAVVGLVDEVINLGFTEALWRKKQKTQGITGTVGKYIPELIHVYPTYRFHVTKGTIAAADAGVYQKIQKFLATLPENAVIFCPSGIGNHVDHLLVREACLNSRKHVVLWADFPYVEKELKNSTSDTGWKQWNFPVRTKEKRKLMQDYRSQYTAMFGDTRSKLPNERFFSKEDNV